MLQDADWKLTPQDIEARSFALIDAEAGAHGWEPRSWSLVRRLVHATADFDWVKDVVVGPGALEAGVEALRAGATVVSDTVMAQSGFNARNLARLGSRSVCFIGDPRAAEAAARSGLTRALAAVDLALAEAPDAGYLWVFGNAPTALLRLMERLRTEPALPRPKLVAAFPVGFVNALESKKALAASELTFVTNLSRKGGSNVAAAALNALSLLALA
ncbi:MAG: precorrin-8X methylmutase [Deltaproteobacteria bacterium]|jgi:precorrin-8X/cobalt-precorrin-8 methylmutase|nr:precorrin-8X methylmutase [Deltaproteobacteria bacterium]